LAVDLDFIPDYYLRHAANCPLCRTHTTVSPDERLATRLEKKYPLQYAARREEKERTSRIRLTRTDLEDECWQILQFHQEKNTAAFIGKLANALSLWERLLSLDCSRPEEVESSFKLWLEYLESVANSEAAVEEGAWKMWCVKHCVDSEEVTFDITSKMFSHGLWKPWYKEGEFQSMVLKFNQAPQNWFKV
jgi:hypothetical protein